MAQKSTIRIGGAVAGAVIATLIFLVMGVRAQSFKSKCDTVTGQVTHVEKHTKRTRKKGRTRTKTSYRVDYTFEVDGRTYQGEDTLSSHPGSGSITVYYNANNPSDSQLDLDNPTLLFLMALLCAGGGGYGVYRMRRQT